jgi:hypothetical protein
VTQGAVCTTNGKTIARTVRPMPFVSMIAGKESAKIVAQVTVNMAVGNINAGNVRRIRSANTVERKDNVKIVAQVAVNMAA